MSVPLYLRDTGSFICFVFSSWRHVPITLYLLVWFACSSCRCIVAMIDAHVDLYLLTWLIGVLTICFCFASLLAGFLVFFLPSLQFTDHHPFGIDPVSIYFYRTLSLSRIIL